MSMKFEWKIIYIGPTEVVGGNQTEKRTFVLEENVEREHKASIAIDLWGQKVNLLDWFEVDDIVSASLNFKANYSNTTDKYYNGVSARGIRGIEVGVNKEPEEEDNPF